MYKVFTKILTKIFHENQPPEQAGFRASYSTIDHLQSVNQILEIAEEYNIKIHIAFVDYRKAFDTVEHTSVLNSLKAIGVDNKYIRLIGKLYTNSTAKIRTEIEGTPFKIERGVKQGDPISPKLFTCLLEQVFRKLDCGKKRYGLNINGKRLTNLRFADDIVLFAKTGKEMEYMLKDLNGKSEEVGLKMNPGKTKLMSLSGKTAISLNGTTIEYTDEYTYLGQSISLTKRGEKEIRRRVAMAWGKFWSLKFIFQDRSLKQKTKIEILESCVTPVLIYGCQTWACTQNERELLQKCQRKMERRILNIKLSDRVTNVELRRKTKMQDVARQAWSLKWKWGGHAARLQQDRWAYVTTMWDPRIGKRSRGRPRRRWSDDFTRTLGAKWSRTARDRIKWRDTMKDLTHPDQ